MRVLALDHGSSRCGCAISDPSGTIVRPLSAVSRPDSAAGLDALAALAQQHAATHIVVGLPRLVGGDEGLQARAARSFAGRLRLKTDLPVELFDERFTTRMARSSTIAGATADEDSLAAAHLLEDYLRVHVGGPGAGHQSEGRSEGHQTT